MKKTTLTIILTSILALSVSFGQERPRLARLIVAKAVKEKVSSGDIVRKDRPELSDETQEQVNELKGKKEALHAKLKENIANRRRCDQRRNQRSNASLQASKPRSA